MKYTMTLTLLIFITIVSGLIIKLSLIEQDFLIFLTIPILLGSLCLWLAYPLEKEISC